MLEQIIVRELLDLKSKGNFWFDVQRQLFLSVYVHSVSCPGSLPFQMNCSVLHSCHIVMSWWCHTSLQFSAPGILSLGFNTKDLQIFIIYTYL